MKINIFSKYYNTLPAIDRLKNYGKYDICVEEFNDCILSHTRIHLSKTDADESTDCLLDDMVKKLQDTSGGHLNDMFSKSIMNSDFDHDEEHSIKARYSLKQLWEESCVEADNIGDEGVKELEKQLLLFRQYCNQKITSITVNEVGLNIPMTNGHYASTVTRVYNTHHM